MQLDDRLSKLRGVWDFWIKIILTIICVKAIFFLDRPDGQYICLHAYLLESKIGYMAVDINLNFAFATEEEMRPEQEQFWISFKYVHLANIFQGIV